MKFSIENVIYGATCIVVPRLDQLGMVLWYLIVCWAITRISYIGWLGCSSQTTNDSTDAGMANHSTSCKSSFFCQKNATNEEKFGHKTYEENEWETLHTYNLYSLFYLVWLCVCVFWKYPTISTARRKYPAITMCTLKINIFPINTANRPFVIDDFHADACQ